MGFIRPSENPIFNCHNSRGINLITRLRLVFSHLLDHKFRQNFQGTLNPIRSSRENVETATRYLLHYFTYFNKIMTLNNPQNFEENILGRNYHRLSGILLVGDSSFNDAKNTGILNATVPYIFDTKAFDVPIINIWKFRKLQSFKNPFTVMDPP